MRASGSIIHLFQLMRAPAALLLMLVTAVAAPSARQPLPDRETFLAEARKRLVSNPDLRAQFAYRERRTEMNFNPLGRMGPGPEQVFEVFPGPTRDLTYRRLIARDDTPLSPREIADQDHEHLAKLEAHRRERAGESLRGRTRREALERERREEARQQADEVLGLFTFTLAGRAVLEGQPAIIVQFTPRADARPRSREARLAAAFEGRAWVHEHQFEVMRLEATATSDVSFGFGMIARLHEGATVTLVRRTFDVGRWLPVESRFEGTGRALLLRRVTIKSVYEYSDYRPFDPDRLVVMLAGSGRTASQ